MITITGNYDSVMQFLTHDSLKLKLRNCIRQQTGIPTTKVTTMELTLVAESLTTTLSMAKFEMCFYLLKHLLFEIHFAFDIQKRFRRRELNPNLI